MSNGVLFAPNASVKIDATTSSSNSAIGGGKSIRVQNVGNVPVYIKFGNDSSLTATASDIPIMNGSGPEMFRRPQGATHVAAITASGAASVIFTTGEGE